MTIGSGRARSWPVLGVCGCGAALPADVPVTGPIANAIVPIVAPSTAKESERMKRERCLGIASLPVVRSVEKTFAEGTGCCDPPFKQQAASR
ncbi:hypothetical protein GCM10027569_66000 [Flindersiella endophytica]